MLTKWIIAIGNTEADGVRMLYTIGSVDQIKRALVELALEDKSNDEESFNYGTEDISDVEETADSKTNEVTVLNAYNVFSDYHRRTVEPSVSGTREHSSRYHTGRTGRHACTSDASGACFYRINRNQKYNRRWFFLRGRLVMRGIWK